jgi:hypothetical protein
LQIALEVAGDVIITGALIIALLRSKTDYKATNSTINQLIAWVLFHEAQI